MRDIEIIFAITCFLRIFIIEKEINFSKTELPTKLEEYELVKIDVIDEIYSTYQRELEIFKEL